MRRSWSDLPEGAIILISQFTTTRFDKIHIRSVCSNWRKSVPPPPKSSPKLPMLLYFYNDCVTSDHVLSVYKLFKTTVFLLQQPETNQKWLVTVSEPRFDNKTCLLNPFTSRCLGEGFPDYAFPNKVLDLFDLRVTQVSTRYNLRLIGEVDEDDDNREDRNLEIDFKLVDDSKLDHDQVCHKAELLDDFEKTESFLILNHHLSRVEGVTVGDDEWTRVGEEKTDYCDIVSHNDFFYCVDRYGTVIGVEDSTYEIDQVIPSPQCFLGEWYLVKAGKDLYLVGRDFRVCGNKVYYHDDDEAPCFVAKPYTAPLPVLFHVFLLNCDDPLIPDWDEVRDLNGYIFFVSRNGSFAIEAADCRPCGGNCIIYVDEIKYQYYDDNGGGVDDNLPLYDIQELGGVKVGVYDFIQGTSLPLSRYPNLFQMFWPPPDWSAMMSTGSCSSPLSPSSSSSTSSRMAQFVVSEVEDISQTHYAVICSGPTGSIISS